MMQNLSKNFKLERDLGSGGFGIARLVKRKGDGKRFVIKEIHAPLIDNAAKMAAKREIDNMMRLQGISDHILE